MLTDVKLDHFFAERGSVDSNVRWCWRTPNLSQVHEKLVRSNVRVSSIYQGPGGIDYFDFWATAEGTRLTAQADDTLTTEGFVPSWIRIWVRDLASASEWYQTFLGAVIVDNKEDEGYQVLGLSLEHHPDKQSLLVLETLPEGAYTGNIDSPIRPYFKISDRQAMLDYRQHLIDSGVTVSSVIGKGFMVLFHFYDPDGNRINVIQY